MARHAEDVVFRRLPIGHDPSAALRVLPSVVEMMADRFRWDAAVREAEAARVVARLDAGRRRLDDALGTAR
jgi:glycerol-3-phosphate dehydrogenase